MSAIINTQKLEELENFVSRLNYLTEAHFQYLCSDAFPYKDNENMGFLYTHKGLANELRAFKDELDRLHTIELMKKR